MSNERKILKQSFVRLSPDDNCVVAIELVPSGTILHVNESLTIEVRSAIPPGHKIAITAIQADQPVLKYGWPIGIAKKPIAAGEWIHSHNLQNDHRVDWTEWTSSPARFETESASDATFMGYRRANGKVGTRNYIAIVSTVNCSASVARWSARRFDSERLKQFANVDGVIAIRHETGCGMAYEGTKHKMLERVLAGIVKHANVAGAVLVGLGCEQATISHLLNHAALTQISNLPQTKKFNTVADFPVVNIQNAGGSRLAIETIESAVLELLPRINQAERTAAPISNLCVGLKCGGSDGYSGITANPALGVASDLLIAAGGSTILGETTEIYGAEHLLMQRARTPEIAAELQKRLDWWTWYTGLFGEEMDHNPSTGNKAGGLTTIAEKSLGAVSKSGRSPLVSVIDYATPALGSGLHMMDSPGFDPACVTGMMASGANVIAFTTGRGSCFGSKPVPSMKITTNSALFHSMPEDMDFDCGTILQGQSVQQSGELLLRELIEIASGKKTKSELLGYGEDEFVPWTVGPVL